MPDTLPVETAGLLKVGVTPADEAALCLVTVLLATDVLPDALVALLLDELLPTVPRLVLELVPTPLLTVVLSVSANTRVSA